MNRNRKKKILDYPFDVGEQSAVKEIVLTPFDIIDVFNKNENFVKLVETFELELV